MVDPHAIWKVVLAGDGSTNYGCPSGAQASTGTCVYSSIPCVAVCATDDTSATILFILARIRAVLGYGKVCVGNSVIGAGRGLQAPLGDCWTCRNSRSLNLRELSHIRCGIDLTLVLRQFWIRAKQAEGPAGSASGLAGARRSNSSLNQLFCHRTNSRLDLYRISCESTVGATCERGPTRETELGRDGTVLVCRRASAVVLHTPHAGDTESANLAHAVRNRHSCSKCPSCVHKTFGCHGV